MKFGVFGSMNETTCLLLADMNIKSQQEISQRVYYEGELYGHDCVMVISRWGKVAASIATTTLITQFKVDTILFTTLAGSISEKLKIGDVYSKQLDFRRGVELKIRRSVY
ncbi:MAG: hypothetical protein KIT27_07575 [Legionellales bacterium]|nr:hypothetical protein [Legionellales bacterium]